MIEIQSQIMMGGSLLKRFHDWLERVCFRIETWEFTCPLPRNEVIKRLRTSTDLERPTTLRLPKLPKNRRILMSVGADHFVLYAREPAVFPATWAILSTLFFWIPWISADAPSSCFVGTVRAHAQGCRIQGTYSQINRYPGYRRGMILACSATIVVIAFWLVWSAVYDLACTLNPDLWLILRGLLVIPVLPAFYLIPYLHGSIGHWWDKAEKRMTRRFLEWIVLP